MELNEEFLSEVMGCVELDIVTRADHRHIWYIYKTDPERIVRSINIYELAHKCKEWLYKQGGMGIDTSMFNKSKNVIKHSISIDYPNSVERFVADTEPEAIFKACEFIMASKE